MAGSVAPFAAAGLATHVRANATSVVHWLCLEHTVNLPLEQRVRRLERRNLLLIVLALPLLVGAFARRSPSTQDVPDVVRARRVEIVDADGVVRLELVHNVDETGLFIRDSAGVVRLGAAQFAHGGGGFALHGPNARGAAVLYLKGTGNLTFYDSTGAPVARFPSP